jgi:hypothetical protein
MLLWLMANIALIVIALACGRDGGATRNAGSASSSTPSRSDKKI